MTAIHYDGTKYLYKFTLEGGRSLFADVAFHPPRSGKPGEWMPETINFGDFSRTGYYGLLESHLPYWTGPELWLIESADAWRPDADGDKMVGRVVRLAAKIGAWTRASMIAFACDALERALPAFETPNPKDHRPRAALAAVREYLANPGRADLLRGPAADAADAGKEAALAAHHAKRCADEPCDPRILDAARVARAVAAMAESVSTADPNAYKPFVFRPDSAEERKWQVARKLAYINEK